jgi:Ca-activated chloride channel family protein
MTHSSRRAYLHSGAAVLAAALAGCSSAPTATDTGPGTTNGKNVDDWQYDPDSVEGGTGGSNASYQSAGGSGGAATASAEAGFAVGGAKDVTTFRRNVEEGYLPLPSDLSYEGLFYDYYFDTGGNEACESLFCPTYSTAVTADPLSGETERYLTVGLDSVLDANAFERPALDLVVLLDISGSMASPFDQYYYDDGEKKQVEDHSERPKIDIAAESVADLTEQLQPGDRFGMVVFNDEATVAKPMRTVETTDMDAIRGHITDLKAGGGTRLSGGIDTATDLLGEYAGGDPSRETRIVTLTDAMPNLGTTSDGGLLDDLSATAKRGIHATFVGVGLDFNTEIVDAITAVPGANYYSVHSTSQFQRRLAEEFAYMITPLVFDLELSLSAPGYDIAQVYGSTDAEEATGSILRESTLFPAPTRDGRTRGGVILVQLARTEGSETLTLETTWRTCEGERGRDATTVSFPTGGPEQFENSGIRKAVLLARYADLVKNWMLTERGVEGVGGGGGGGDGGDEPSDGIVVPPDHERGRWERTSDPLTVSTAYRRRMATFGTHFERETNAIGDDTLQQELDVLRRLANSS